MAKQISSSRRAKSRRAKPASVGSSKPQATELREECAADGIVMQLWRAEGSSDIDLRLSFRTIEGGKSHLTVSRDQRRRPASVLAELEKKGAVVGENPLPSLSRLLMTENLQVHRLVSKPGWHGKTFVLAGSLHRVAFGTKSQHLIAPVAAHGHAYVGRYQGSAAEWRARVGTLAQQSTTMSFAILVALAAPLAARAQLPEGALFNFFAESSTGKTTLARVAASVAGDPDQIGNWDFTLRGMQERAAAHNGYAVVLDDTEKVAGGLTELVRSVTHIIAGGQSKTYSASVQDKLRSLTWFCFGLSTSHEGMNTLALRSRSPRTLGAQVRLIDLPVRSRSRWHL